MTEIDQRVKDIKSKVKQHESIGDNPKLLKMLTTKDRLAILEMTNIIVIQRLEKLEKQLLAIWLCLSLLTFYVITDGIMKLWQ